MKMKKGFQEKDIPENLISDYQHMGWKKVEEKKPDTKPTVEDEE